MTTYHQDKDELPKVFSFDMELAVQLIQPHYEEEWRVFHKWDHIIYGFNVYMSYFQDKRILHDPNELALWQQHNNDALVLAWMMHDIVYLPGFAGNEEASMKMVPYICGLLGVRDLIPHVQYLVLMTFHTADAETMESLIKQLPLGGPRHKVWGADIINDMDMHGFATAEYANNGDKVQAEFANFMQPEDRAFYEKQFRDGRIAFLNWMLKRGPIFKTPQFAGIIENQALANIYAEMETLRNPLAQSNKERVPCKQ